MAKDVLKTIELPKVRNAAIKTIKEAYDSAWAHLKKVRRGTGTAAASLVAECLPVVASS